MLLNRAIAAIGSPFVRQTDNHEHATGLHQTFSSHLAITALTHTHKHLNMAPAVTIDNTPDFDFTPSKPSQRTLLLAPPSVSSHPTILTSVAEAYDRNATDIQMLDRLALGLVSLPAATYDVVLLLTDVDGTRQDRHRLLSREVMERIVSAMKIDGLLKGQEGSLGGSEQTEAILAGLVRKDGVLVKPNSAGMGQTVQLSFGKKKGVANAAAVPANAVEAVNTGKRKNGVVDVEVLNGNGGVAHANGRTVRATPAGVGFVDSNDDFDGGLDDGSGYHSEEDVDMEIPSQEELERAERVDPEGLLTEEDRLKPLNIRECLSLTL